MRASPRASASTSCAISARRTTNDIVIENTAWDGLIPSLQTGKADCVISSMTITDERKQTVDFSDAYAQAQLAILANSGSGISSVDDLNQQGKTVAVKTGSTGDVYATNHLTEATITRLADESACVTEVVQGNADGLHLRSAHHLSKS